MMMFVRQATCQSGVIIVSEDLPPQVTSDAAAGPDAAAISRGLDGARLAGTVASRVADQARLTAGAAKARRVVNTDGEPGVLDVTPLLVEEFAIGVFYILLGYMLFRWFEIQAKQRGTLEAV